MSELKRVSWLDYGKCICMLMVIFSHTVTLYTGRTNTFLNLMSPTRLLVFFFISGYLTKIETFNFKKTMTSIVKKLLFPYFLFTTIIFIPKHFAHGTEISFSTMAYEILGGYASWFVAALAVSKITLAICIKYIKNLIVLGITCVLLAVVGFLATQYTHAPIPWYAHYGLISLIYLYMGILYKKYEQKLSQRIGWQAIVSTIVYFLFVCLDYFWLRNSVFFYSMKAGDVSAVGVMSFLCLSTLGIWMMVSIVKSIPEGVKWMSYIGRNSLTYYYLNTGLLLVILAALSRLNLLCNSGWFIFPLFIVVVLILTVISQGILRYAPWMVGNFSSKKTVDKK